MTTTIRRLTRADFEVAGQILNSAFDSRSEWELILDSYLALQPDGWFLAEWKAEPVGMVGAVDYGPFAYIGLMGVKSSMQQRGIGAQLFQYLLDWLDQRGTPVALLDATKVGKKLYRKMGFVEEQQTFLLQQKMPVPAEKRPLKAVSRVRQQDIPQLITFDALLFGASREVIFRALWENFPGRSFIVHDDAGNISGYLFAQSRRLGPWVARTPEDAEALLNAALQFPYTGIPSVIIPAENQVALELLNLYGFRIQRATTHMRRGGTQVPIQRPYIYGQTSFAIG